MIAMTQTLVEKCDLKKRRANNALCDEYGVESIDKLYKIDKGTEKSVKVFFRTKVWKEFDND